MPVGHGSMQSPESNWGLPQWQGEGESGLLGNDNIHGSGGSAGGSNAGDFISHITHIGTDQLLKPIIDPKTEVAKTYTDPSKVNEKTGYETNDKGVTGDDGKSKGEKAAEAVGLAADTHVAAVKLAITAAKDLKTATKVLSQTGTVIGLIAGGVPAGINIISNFRNGQSQDWQDWGNLVVAGIGIGAEIFGVGEVADASIAVGTVAWDLYGVFSK